jgi:hypothetical protein
MAADRHKPAEVSIGAETTPGQPAETLYPVDLEAAVAAALRALKTALAALASQYGYRRETPYLTLLALGATQHDLETLRQFLAAHDQPAGETP